MLRSGDTPSNDAPSRGFSIPHPGWFLTAAVLLVLLAAGLRASAPYRRSEALIGEVQRLGGGVETRAAGPEWLQVTVPAEYRASLRDVTAINLPRSPVDDRWLDRLRQTPLLEELALTGPDITDVGLKGLARLDRLRSLFLINCPAVTDLATQELQRALPALKIQRRGPAMLGIAGAPGSKGCVVSFIQPGSPAHLAGLHPGDVITKFEAQPIADFEELVVLIGRKQPRDAVKLEVLREGKQLSIAAVLDPWK